MTQGTFMSCSMSALQHKRHRGIKDNAQHWCCARGSSKPACMAFAYFAACQQCSTGSTEILNTMLNIGTVGEVAASQHAWRLHTLQDVSTAAQAAQRHRRQWWTYVLLKRWQHSWQFHILQHVSNAGGLQAGDKTGVGTLKVAAARQHAWHINVLHRVSTGDKGCMSKAASNRTDAVQRCRSNQQIKSWLTTLHKLEAKHS